MKKKLTAIILTILMMGTHLLTLGNAVIALGEPVNNQNSKTNHANVEMNSYFEGESHSKTFEIGKDAKMYFKIKVMSTGYLKNTSIKLIDNNYEFDTNGFESEAVQSITANEIKVKQINSGNQEAVIEVPIILPKSEKIAADLFGKISKVQFTGTYIDGEGKEKQIQKEVEQEVKWTTTSEVEVAGQISKYIPYHNEDEYGVMMQAKITSGIKDNLLPIKNTKLEISIPEITIEQTNTEEGQNANTSTEENIAQNTNTSAEDNTQNAETNTQQTSQNKTIKPERVTVVANSSKATNGIDNGTFFGESNYHYEEETNKIIIDVKNEPDEQGKIAWGQGKDEYIITYTFVGKEVYDTVNSQLEKVKETTVTEEEKENGAKNENAITGAITVKAGIAVYQAEEQTLNLEGNIPYEIEEQLGNIVDFDMNATQTISKGYIYTNYDKTEEARRTEGKQTTFNLNYTAQVYDANLLTGVEFQVKGENLIGETKVKSEANIITKQIAIAENIFQKMLGEEGKIEVTNTNGEALGTINKDSQKDNNQNYILNIEENKVNEIIIKTTKPITEGKIEIDVEKAFVVEQSYSKKEMQDFTQVEVAATAQTNTDSKILQKTIDMTEPVSKAEVSIEEGKENLSTVITNKNVGIRIVLDTSNTNNALYKNPTLKIVLPSYINRIDIKNYDIVMANGLKIKGAPQVKTEDGKQVIYITLEGTQTEYTIDAEYEGTIVILNTDLTTKTLTPTYSDKITMEFTNANEISANQKGTAEATINFVAPTGVVAANGISNYVAGKNIMSISEKGMTGEIATYSPKQVATIYGKIVNNYENNINQVVVLGRIPAKDNTTIDEETSLGSTFNTTLKTGLTLKGIEAEKYTTYYSEKVDASRDLSNNENGWSTTPTTSSKSYMIVLAEDYEMKQGQMIEFSYDVEIPENLKHDNTASEMYKVYYHNISSIGRMAEAKTAPIMTVTTGQGPELTVELKSTVGSTVYEGQIIKMKAVVTNTGSVTAKNVKVTVPVPENAKFVNYVIANGFYDDTATSKVLDVGTIEPGETKEVSYFIKIDSYIMYEPDNSLDEGDEGNEGDIEYVEAHTSPFPKEVSSSVTLTADDLVGNIPSNEYKFTIQDGFIAMKVVGRTNEGISLKKGDTLIYDISLMSISNSEELTNTVVTIPLVNGVKYKNAVIRHDPSKIDTSTDGIEYDASTNAVKVNAGTLKTNKLIILELEVEEFEGNISMMAKVTADGTPEQYSNIVEYQTEKLDIEIEDLTATPKYVPEGEQITYNLKIKNNGKSIVYHVNVTDLLPTEVEFAYANYQYSGKTQSVTSLTNGKVNVTINQIQPGEIAEVNVVAVAKLLPDKQDKQISNKMTVTVKNYDAEDTNTVTNTIEYNQKLHQEIENQDVTPAKPTATRYRITGTAWLDSNQNGKRDENESVLPNIPVMLLNKEDNSIVKDADSGTQKKTSTGDNGAYEFTNLEKGEYIVIFLYDASQYSLTTYQEKDVDASLNSDAININVTIDGVKTIAGISDAIKIIDENVRDIDIGLYVSEKFDLRLDKYISKVTVITPSNGTKVYHYNNSKLTKREIYSKDVGSSSIIVEYKIVVTNEGQIDGYAKKLIDYLPQEAKFNTELNKDWYLSETTGTVLNSSLANEKIAPGQSKEVTLILSYNITEKNIGTLINNNAEIYESYNEQGLQDMDSTSGNKAQDEDDMSKADIILSLVTGTIIKYTAIILGVITILGFGIFMIKRNVLEKKNN